ncbi:hypothetical protein LIA77_11073 [Sarocladium implicatum]|nr:hypothetical protein LIA77_11073 [Sarocladium implicatum]
MLMFSFDTIAFLDYNIRTLYRHIRGTMSDPSTNSAAEETSKTYEAGCHCGDVRFTVTLKPSLETRKVTNCNCSICRRKGYLLVCKTRTMRTWLGTMGRRRGAASIRYDIPSPFAG